MSNRNVESILNTIPLELHCIIYSNFTDSDEIANMLETLKINKNLYNQFCDCITYIQFGNIDTIDTSSKNIKDFDETMNVITQYAKIFPRLKKIDVCLKISHGRPEQVAGNINRLINHLKIRNFRLFYPNILEPFISLRKYIFHEFNKKLLEKYEQDNQDLICLMQSYEQDKEIKLNNQFSMKGFIIDTYYTPTDIVPNWEDMDILKQIDIRTIVSFSHMLEYGSLWSVNRIVVNDVENLISLLLINEESNDIDHRIEEIEYFNTQFVSHGQIDLYPFVKSDLNNDNPPDVDAETFVFPQIKYFSSYFSDMNSIDTLIPTFPNLLKIRMNNAVSVFEIKEIYRKYPEYKFIINNVSRS